MWRPIYTYCISENCFEYSGLDIVNLYNSVDAYTVLCQLFKKGGQNLLPAVVFVTENAYFWLDLFMILEFYIFINSNSIG